MAERKPTSGKKTGARKTAKTTARGTTAPKKAPAKRKPAGAKKALKVTLVRGLAGKRKSHIEAVRSLGLRKPGQSRVLEDNPMVRGNIRKAHYLLSVEEVQDEAS